MGRHLCTQCCCRSYVAHHPYSLPSTRYHKLLKDIEEDFNITLLDATLGLETDTVLGVHLNGDKREIQHVEDTGDPDSESCGTDDNASHTSSPALSISTPSSDTESSAANSPITPCVPHFPLPLPQEENANVQADASAHDVERVSSGVDRSALDKPAKEGRPSRMSIQQVQQPDSDSDSDSDFGFSSAPYRRVSYGAM